MARAVKGSPATLRELARAAKVPPSTLARVLNGQREAPPAVAKAVGQALERWARQCAKLAAQIVAASPQGRG